MTRDGSTFALEPSSRAHLEREFGEIAHFRSRIFIAHETQADYETVHGAIVPQIVQLLTGLSLDRLEAHGGVAFHDPATDREIPLSAA